MHDWTSFCEPETQTSFSFPRIAESHTATLANPRYRSTQLSVDTIELICKALKISMADFFTVTLQQ